MNIFSSKPINKLLTASAVALAMNSAANAETSLFDDRLKITFMGAQGFQSISAKDGAYDPADENQEASFLRIRANLMMSFQVTDYISVHAEYAEEPNDFGGQDAGSFTINNDFAGIEFDLLGLSGKPSDTESFGLRLGNIGQSTFLFNGFQDGADSQNNSVIGNSPVDFATAESGAQLTYSKQFNGGGIEKFSILGAVTGSHFGEAFDEGRGFNYVFNTIVETSSGFDFGIAYQKANQEDQLDFNNAGIASLDGVVRPGYVFGDGENYNFSSSATSARDTHIAVSPGIELQTISLNAKYQPTQNTALIGRVGWVTDEYSFVDDNGNATTFADANGEYSNVIAEDSEVFYYVLEAQQYIMPEKLYVAARYTNASNESDWATGGTTLDRIQVAAGYWIADNTLFKFEYVDQSEDENSGGQIGAGFDGFSAEVALKF